MVVEGKTMLSCPLQRCHNDRTGFRGNCSRFVVSKTAPPPREWLQLSNSNCPYQQALHRPTAIFRLPAVRYINGLNLLKSSCVENNPMFQKTDWQNIRILNFCVEDFWPSAQYRQEEKRTVQVTFWKQHRGRHFQANRQLGRPQILRKACRTKYQTEAR